jgi:hypothetical protein
MATRTWVTLQLLSFKTFWLKLKLLYIAGTLEGMGLWSSMWAVMKALTIGGMATQFTLFRKGMGLFAILKTLGAALVVAWATTWETLKAIAAAGWALLRAQAVVGAIAQVGIFSKLRSALVVIWTTTASSWCYHLAWYGIGNGSLRSSWNYRANWSIPRLTSDSGYFRTLLAWTLGNCNRCNCNSNCQASIHRLFRFSTTSGLTFQVTSAASLACSMT